MIFLTCYKSLGGSSMTVGQVAGLIAAIAFAVLVIFIGIFLLNLVKALNDASRNLDSITIDINDLSDNVSDLIENVNDRIDQIDPVFQAAAEIGTTVTEATEKAKSTTDNLKNKLNLFTKTSILSIVANTAMKLFSKKNKKK
ncbi:DUF948 domain-containing protein [Fructilactobacillus sanfranciscensis]|uniref:DUF948 domain-containing protein n=2 Tax=Fructilactobacillus sanfranciscensis TaxID=1625 RepID=A0A5C4TLQ9_FRUSA|nr:DUF948 domain-containing protein [Fructilactobacillus sanfranciscensis]NDS15824.1 DUF948 domain-containing protein [Fructilactobacillus sanfranciscensis]TNK91121.1 DUF948 domain-containing protein [Fructilactobacillus sanfranciscensis]TNK96371.1 DUF948 domain-containing protein [Fructilactobacillus sanfranciscensis]TNL00076.1 DUF948 domain-containing protein [Fructilactobacillus sanfranciscensis]